MHYRQQRNLKLSVTSDLPYLLYRLSFLFKNVYISVSLEILIKIGVLSLYDSYIILALVFAEMSL